MTVLFLVLVLLQVADVATTYRIIRKGMGREANPVMAWLIAKLGLALGLVAPKMAMLALVYLFVLEQCPYVLAPLIALYLWAIFNNAKVIRATRNKSPA